MKSKTPDTFLNGRIKVKQDRSGYRFSIDSILLACYAKLRPGDKVLDLGTGCGIVSLILAYREPNLKIFGIEVQKELADIAVSNVEENHMGGIITILYKDMKELKNDMLSGPVDLVVSNPPYWKAKSGRINPDMQRAVARHEIKVSLDDITATVRRVLRTAGSFVTIYSAERITDLLTHLRSAGIEPKFLRMIHSDIKTEAKLVLVEGIKGGRPGVKIGPPLIIYDEKGDYTQEVEEMFSP
ncbi:MAG: tRNA1(Val) (adenine(37)-N6)-methyltransferase [Desulfobacterales bacterium]|nr:tRNA1(Val) (adenine(37)-N6)-methyltransferase [Desulfobacterales bacterium]MDX2509802.1 tRNA1(Val) (adenine(37)-N6)-methyltransferase [Desulfobacterales bacterium]